MKTETARMRLIEGCLLAFHLHKNDPRNHTKSTNKTSSASCIFVDRFTWQGNLSK
jgi:hypothetical protein